jgi:hypothetical protein
VQWGCKCGGVEDGMSGLCVSVPLCVFVAVCVPLCVFVAVISQYMC